MLSNLYKHWKIVIAVVLGIVLLVVFGVLWRSGEPPENADRIYTDVYIHGQAVGGMSVAEAEAALTARFQTGLGTRKVNYHFNGEVVEYTFADFDARFDFSALLADALEYSHGRGISLRVERISGEYVIDAPPMFVFSSERMEDVMRQLSERFDVLPQNASFYIEHGWIDVTEERAGYGVDIVEASHTTREILESLNDGTVELTATEAAPLYTTADFDFEYSVIGSFATAMSGTPDEPRHRNIGRASERIHNIVVYPGEVFSAAALIESNSPESGYETAIVLVDGEPVEDTGGGVCQVVTTLYNAALYAELEIIQRNSHSAPVGYVDMGFDATVAGDYYDLKFINNTPRPILVTSRVSHQRLTIEIHGLETRAHDRGIRFVSRTIETIPPEPYREVVDPSIPRGEKLITLLQQDGYRVELYKYVFVGNDQVGEIQINTSEYRPLQGVIAIGAG
jgi:vancomycin resistance protein YoaR